MVNSWAMSESPELVALAESAADAAGVPRQLFLGLIKRESDWNPQAISRAGAIGLAQVMPIWASPSYAASIGMPGLTVEALRDPWTNATVGARILASELGRFGLWELALMAYNAGAPAVLKAIANAGTKDPAAVSDKLPAAETRAYWQAVMNWAKVYANKMDATIAAVENATAEVVENVKESGTAAPLMLLGVAILGMWWWASR